MIGKTLRTYQITEQLSVGEKSAVYKATDIMLGRQVVIKVIPPELSAKVANLKRFEREARLASALDHPNICTILDLNEVDGVHFVVMQAVEGKNVHQLVAGRPLELKTALLIGLQVADALAVAHSRGIIHRDIKSTNVMVTSSGQVKVLDFGLAKLLDDTEGTTSGIHRTELTKVGIPYGTATYAAPEQTSGDRVDKRADIFSLGVLLYEMLTGTLPFRGETTTDVRYAVLHDPPQPISELRSSGIPPHLQHIIDRALAKDPEDRFQNMDAFRDELWQVLQVINASGTNYENVAPEPSPHHAGANPVSRAVRWLKSITRTESPATSPNLMTPSNRGVHERQFTTVADQEKKSLAILCFRNLSNDSASSFYEFSLADALITELARVRSLVVRPSSVIARYQGEQRDPREIGKELNVSSVLTAGFIHSGERLRVTAQLIDVSSGELLWSDRIDAATSDIITLTGVISQRIIEGLNVEVSRDVQGQIATTSTQNPAAYEQYLRGRDLFARFIFRSFDPEDRVAAIRHFRLAIELDKNFELAYDGLATCLENRVSNHPAFYFSLIGKRVKGYAVEYGAETDLIFAYEVPPPDLLATVVSDELDEARDTDADFAVSVIPKGFRFRDDVWHQVAQFRSGNLLKKLEFHLKAFEFEELTEDRPSGPSDYCPSNLQTGFYVTFSFKGHIQQSFALPVRLVRSITEVVDEWPEKTTLVIDLKKHVRLAEQAEAVLSGLT